MFLLDYVKPKEAQGPVADIYGIFPPHLGVPAPLQLFSASPGLLGVQFNGLKYFMHHEKLSFPLLAAIRYTVAAREGFEYCVQLNGGLLQAAGAEAGELEAMKQDPGRASLLEDSERNILIFVHKALYEPDAVDASKIEALRAQGWRDSDLLDAVSHGAQMIASGKVFRAFSR